LSRHLSARNSLQDTKVMRGSMLQHDKGEMSLTRSSAAAPDSRPRQALLLHNYSCRFSVERDSSAIEEYSCGQVAELKRALQERGFGVRVVPAKVQKSTESTINLFCDGFLRDIQESAISTEVRISWRL
jgi:hypothetical protein